MPDRPDGITDEAVEAAAWAWRHGTAPPMPGPRLKAGELTKARLALEAALPHLRPPVGLTGEEIEWLDGVLEGHRRFSSSLIDIGHATDLQAKLRAELSRRSQEKPAE